MSLPLAAAVSAPSRIICSLCWPSDTRHTKPSGRQTLTTSCKYPSKFHKRNFIPSTIQPNGVGPGWTGLDQQFSRYRVDMLEVSIYKITCPTQGCEKSEHVQKAMLALLSQPMHKHLKHAIWSSTNWYNLYLIWFYRAPIWCPKAKCLQIRWLHTETWLTSA